MDIHIDLEDRSHSKHTCVVADRRWPFRTPASMVECGLGASLAWVLVSPIAYRCCQAVLFRRLGQGLLPNSSRAALAASASSQVQCNASLMFAEEVDFFSTSPHLNGMWFSSLHSLQLSFPQSRLWHTKILLFIILLPLVLLLLRQGCRLGLAKRVMVNS